MQRIAMKYSPIYSPTPLDSLTNVQTLLAYRNAFSREQINVESVIIGRFVGMTKSAMSHYCAMLNKPPRETVKKLRNMISFGGISTKSGLKLPKNATFHDLILSDCFHCIGQVSLDPIAVFPFGLVVDSKEMSMESIKKYMESAVSWMPVKPEIKIMEVKK